MNMLTQIMASKSGSDVAYTPSDVKSLNDRMSAIQPQLGAMAAEGALLSKNGEQQQARVIEFFNRLFATENSLNSKEILELLEGMTKGPMPPGARLIRHFDKSETLANAIKLIEAMGAEAPSGLLAEANNAFGELVALQPFMDELQNRAISPTKENGGVLFEDPDTEEE